MATGKINNEWRDYFTFRHIVDAEGRKGYFEIKDNPDLKDFDKGTSVVFEKGESTRTGFLFKAYDVRLQDTSSQQSRQSTSDRKQPSSPAQRTVEPTPEIRFHNPYTFVPTPPRPLDHKFAGDLNPLECGLDHASLNLELWTGHIPIKLTTVTPLVLPDAGSKKRSSKEHQKYDVLDRIPEPSLRGMLRSAYEVVTNSRYGCFSNDERLKYRINQKKETYPKSPANLLDCSLKPAKNMNQLSPADRLFGWTPQGQKSEGGYKSRLRVVCEEGPRPEIIQRFEDDQHLPLAILDQPKPQQVRFYVAKDKYGKPQCDGLSKQEVGYSGEEKGLRGRKQYWHHKKLEAKKAAAYWEPSVKDRTQEKHNDRYQEYRRPNDNPDAKNSEPQFDHHNRSIRGWIKPGTVFSASLYVQNLQSKELGALLWLLTLNDEIGDGNEKHYFRLGYGKPLGFGSVKMKIDEKRLVNGCLPLGTGKDWKDNYYVALDESSPATLKQKIQESCQKKFKDSMMDAYPDSDNYEADAKQNFENLLFISGFLRALCGPKTDAPIHYPRTNEKPDPKGENFRWFDNNEKGPKLALPEVTSEKGLPYKPTN